MSNRQRHQQPIPERPARKPTLLNATVTFHAPQGDIAITWDAANGDVSYAGEVIHNTNDLGVLHTVAKGIAVTRKPE
jgi:hypothetical protein